MRYNIGNRLRSNEGLATGTIIKTDNRFVYVNWDNIFGEYRYDYQTCDLFFITIVALEVADVVLP